MALITCRNLSKDYPSAAGGVAALKEVNLDIRRGEFIAIMGPSGSGKTTLMNLLGLLDNPSDGTLSFEGRDVTDIGPDDQAAIRNLRIGFVFQSYNLLARLTALENVELPLLYAGVKAREREARSRAMLEAVGLANRGHHWPAQLSGGEQQRVAIARSMVTNPALVLADEPTGALDSKTGEAVLDLFHGLNNQGAAVVLVTHDEAVARHAQRVIRLADGRLVSSASTAAPRRAPMAPRRKVPAS